MRSWFRYLVQPYSNVFKLAAEQIAALQHSLPADQDSCFAAGSRQKLADKAKPMQKQRCRTVAAASKSYVGSLVANDLKFAIVVARFNDLVTKLLLEGALEAFDRHGGDRDDVDVSASKFNHTAHISA